MQAPAVSVLIPTYNRRVLVAEAVASVLAQTEENFELIVVDDGSTDGTAEALEAQLAGDPRATVIRKANGGTASARNRGLEAARAPCVAFLDSDDLWGPRYLSSQLAALEAHPEADLVVGDVTYVNQGRQAESLFADPDFKAPISLDAMCDGAWALPSAMVVRTKVAQEIKFTDRFRIIEDTEFLFRLHIAGHRCILNPDRLVVWRRPAGEGEAAKTDSAFLVECEMLALIEANRHAAADPEAVSERLYTSHRVVAKKLVRMGRLREARDHLRAWMRARPFRIRPRVLYLRSLLARERR